MIEVDNLTKRFGATAAVDGLSFTAPAGTVTGFLGPNGSGKSTTMRVILGLAAPSSGTTRVCGVPYRQLSRPLHTMGSLLDAHRVHRGRTGRAHLSMIAASNGIGRGRVDETISTVGLASVADSKVKAYSLGMLQRLGVAIALLGDPEILMLDEPVNGLDTEGIRWLRTLLRSLADEGRTVLLSSHVMSEIELIADRLVVIGAGCLLADEPIDDFVRRHSATAVRVRSSDDELLAQRLRTLDCRVVEETEGLTVQGLTAGEVGAHALSGRIALTELTPVRSTLEDVFTELVEQHGQYRHREAEVA
ncbi:ABC transporter ATP-binding protein [Nocardia sp. XZ_19_231]|uniref:ABC transporter ATP-binding protein n=1 Tax=Nocardia sp. XZ_19_231 TaxID=2769252 RepID=UPI00188FDB32|nr:ATP-binding cassette domain-containing protein [Nocardia sp. XZ_19_231]